MRRDSWCCDMKICLIIYHERRNNWSTYCQGVFLSSCLSGDCCTVVSLSAVTRLGFMSWSCCRRFLSSSNCHCCSVLKMSGVCQQLPSFLWPERLALLLQSQPTLTEGLCHFSHSHMNARSHLQARVMYARDLWANPAACREAWWSDTEDLGSARLEAVKGNGIGLWSGEARRIQIGCHGRRVRETSVFFLRDFQRLKIQMFHIKEKSWF